MEPNKMPGIAAVERHIDGILVKFTDGRCVFYPAALLFHIVPKAVPQDEQAAW